jgi:hypothetical protein
VMDVAGIFAGKDQQDPMKFGTTKAKMLGRICHYILAHKSLVTCRNITSVEFILIQQFLTCQLLKAIRWSEAPTLPSKLMSGLPPRCPSARHAKGGSRSAAAVRPGMSSSSSRMENIPTNSPLRSRILDAVCVFAVLPAIRTR